NIRIHKTVCSLQYLSLTNMYVCTYIKVVVLNFFSGKSAPTSAIDHSINYAPLFYRNSIKKSMTFGTPDVIWLQSLGYILKNTIVASRAVWPSLDLMNFCANVHIVTRRVFMEGPQIETIPSSILKN